ncbi:MAG: ABC transporter ATP-binding protein/permease [Lachnospiraceae bacterium]|nr:ABC transporter ATP-binding protein/permease [Lachnospiraceae bacterium]
MRKDNNGATSQIKKIAEVVKVLFSTAGKKYPLFFAAESFKTVLLILQPFVALYISPLIVDEIVGERNLKKLIIYALVLIIGEFVLQVLVSKCGNAISKYKERLDNYFNVLIGKHSMELDFQLTEDKAALEQIEKARTGMSWYSEGVYGVAEAVFSFIGNVFKVAGFVTVLAMHAPLLLVFIAVYVIINFFITVKINKISIEAFAKLSKVNRLFGYFGWEIVDIRFGKDIRLYGADNMMLDSWKKNTDASNKHWKWQGNTQYKYGVLSSLLGVLRTILSYFYVAYLAISGNFGVAIFTQLIAAQGGLDATLGGLIWNVTDLVRKCNYAYEYVLFMNYPAALTKGDKALEKKDHEIEFKHVSFAYPGTDRKVLDDISIKIAPGEHLSIVGLNGAGKTTFIKLLCRLYDPTEGEILLDGVNIKEYDYKQYMEQFAPVFQDFRLFALTLGDNISFDRATSEKEQKRIDELIKLVGLETLMEKLDKGKDSNIFKYFDEEGIEPSGGEQQKIAIARALYKDSPVVILDEPTAALDPIAEYDIYRQFNTLIGGKSAFYISHRLSSCQFCDKIAVFSGGKIAEYGTHEQLEKIAGGIYATMFEAQAKYYR